MDSRDSSLSAVVSRDDFSVDEDGLLSVTAGLAKDAALLFQSRRFAECVDVLNQLLQKKEDDPKVLHNIAVSEHFRHGCSDPRKLLDVLDKVKLMVQKRNGDFGRASGEELEILSNLGNSAVSVSKSNTTQLQFSGVNSSIISYTDEFDTSVTMLNIAIILFHLHKYSTASSILESLYQNIEPIDESTALHICLLLLDLVLASRDASKAADVIQYVEKAFSIGHMISQGDNGSGVQHQSSNISLAPNSSIATEASNSDSNANLNTSENHLSRILSDEALDYETLLSTLDISGHSLARPADLSSLNDFTRTSADRPAPAVDLKLKLHLCKVRLLLLTRNLKAAKREVKLAMNIARGGDSSTALLLKSQLEYACGNHRKAIKLLMTSSNRTDSGISSIFYNNLGCIYHQLGKHHTSTVFFSKALGSSSCLRSEKPLKLSTFSQDKSSLIVYNCGLQYLACGRPEVAACCFQKASSVFHKRPLFWVRIAECCLLALEKGLLRSSGSPTDGEVRVHVVGNGKWRKLVVEDGASRSRHLDSLEQDGLLPGDDGQHKLSITFAKQCLVNALYLLDIADLNSLKVSIPSNSASEDDESSQAAFLNNLNHKSLLGGDSKASNVTAVSTQANANGDLKEVKGVSSNPTLQSSIFTYEDMQRRENHMIKQAVLANLSYVELNLENPLKALSAARSLLELPECSRIYIFLGHMYAAEALCRLNRLKEAAEHLSVYVSDRNTIELPYSEEDRKNWKVEKGGDGEELNGGGCSLATNNQPANESRDVVFLKPEEARGTLFVNLAAMSAMQGNLEQAHLFAREALSTIPESPKAILTAVYVDLLIGKAQEALVKLKQCSHVRFLSSGV